MFNFASTLDYHAERRPSKVVVSDGERKVTNSEFFKRVNALASVLADLGIGRGDIVGILMYNRLEFLEVVYAANRVGAAFLPLNYRLSAPEWEYIINHGEVKVLFSEAEFASAIGEMAPRLPRLSSRVMVDSDMEGWLPYATVVEAALGVEFPVVDVDEDDLQRLMYTSGTTSRPKGVCISHRNLMYKNLGFIIQFALTHQDISMTAGPLYHVGALDMGGITTLHAGGSLVLQRKFEPEGLLALIEKEKATTVWLAPAMLNAVLQSPALKSRKLDSIRVIMNGGEKMPEARLKQVLEAFPGVWVADAYGLTETVSSDTFVTEEHMRSKIGSVGKPMPQLSVRIVDDNGAILPPNTVGEIALRGPKVFNGYWHDEEATSNAIRGGWFHTGDMGHLDDDGFLYIDDRKKDMIVSGGENIASPEVERVLYEHPSILEAAVVGQPDQRWGEVPRAFVVLKEGHSLTPDEIREFCRERLAKFKVPAYVDVLTELPRTPSGKVLKRHLREKASTDGAAPGGS